MRLASSNRGEQTPAVGDRGDDKLQIVLVGPIEGIKLITVDIEDEMGVAVVHERRGSPISTGCCTRYSRKKLPNGLYLSFLRVR